MICSHLNVKHVAKYLRTKSHSQYTWMHIWVRTSYIFVTSVVRPWQVMPHCRSTGAHIQVRSHSYVICVVRHSTNGAICEFTSVHIRGRNHMSVNSVARHLHRGQLWLYINDITQDSALTSVTYVAKTLFRRHCWKHTRKVMECRNTGFDGMWGWSIYCLVCYLNFEFSFSQLQYSHFQLVLSPLLSDTISYKNDRNEQNLFTSSPQLNPIDYH
jgi:hypothetical protein